MNIYVLNVGDWSGDGHSQHDSFYFETNKEYEEIVDAYLQACNTWGCSLHVYNGSHEVLNDFEDKSLPDYAVEALRLMKVDFSLFEDIPDEFGGIPFGPYDVFNLFMQLAKSQLPDLQYSRLRAKEITGWRGSDKISGFIGYGVY